MILFLLIDLFMISLSILTDIDLGDIDAIVGIEDE
jgi:hypothetical protein